MSKTRITAEVAAKLGMSRTAVSTVLEAVLEEIIEEVNSGGKVTITGFGSFEKSRRESWNARNPRTGEPVQVPASNTMKFKAAQQVKDTLNT